MELFLNIDAGELPDEPEALYALAHVVNIACGGHAGDDASMARAARLCRQHGTQAGAHPSYVDREGFGRKPQDVPPERLCEQVRDQCRALERHAAQAGCEVRHLKPHGALYHQANRQLAVAQAVIEGAIEALGREVRIIGPPSGFLAQQARAAGLRFSGEEFPDRGHLPGGALIPRGQPGDIVTDPQQVRAAALELSRRPGVETLCVHGDSPGALQLARAVRDAIEELRRTP